jgi:hypothetical protein
MIRFAWLQARTQILVAAGALVIAAIVVALTGPHLHHLYDVNVAHCATRGNCDLAKPEFLKNDKRLMSAFGGVLLVVPAIIGLFWGPPLVARELETGTFRFAWTQSITRTRWFAIKLAIVGVAAMAIAGLLSLIVTWWASPIDTVTANRFSAPLFDERGVVVIGYAAFAVAVGVTAGLVIRRTLPAMATTLVAVIAARVAVIEWIRPKFLAASVRTFAIDPAATGFGRRNSGPIYLQPDSPQIRNAWIQSVRIVDPAGHALTPTGLARLCPKLTAQLDAPPIRSGRPNRAPVPDDLKSSIHRCLAKVGAKFHEVVTYQPAKHYWPFQWIELALFLGVTLALTGFCFWWLRRRLT